MAKKGMSPERAKELREDMGLFSTKLETRRVKKGLSQNGLSVASGVNFRTIQAYEQRTRPIEGGNIKILCSLCIALDCKMEDILEDKTTIERYKLIK